jgi:hypothetical protein
MNIFIKAVNIWPPTEPRRNIDRVPSSIGRTLQMDEGCERVIDARGAATARNT